MFLTDFKCLHRFFLRMLTSVSPNHFSNNVSLTCPFRPRRNRTRHYLLREKEL